MLKVSKAIILAAGFGSRMQPLSWDTPKPLMPFQNQALLDRILKQITLWGVKEVLINLHYKAGDIFAHLHRRLPAGLRVNFSFEPQILNTGGAIRKADWFLDDTPFWLVNSDIIFSLDIQPLLRAMEQSQSLAALWLTAQRGPRTVEMTNGLISNFRSRTPGVPHTYTFTGLHLIAPRIVDFLPKDGSFSVIDVYQKAMQKGENIAGVCVPKSYWADLGTPDAYIAAHADQTGCLAEANSFLPENNTKHFIVSASEAAIAPEADIKRSVIWNKAVLGPQTKARNAVIGRGCVVNHHIPATAVRACYFPPNSLLFKALALLTWHSDCTTVIPLAPRGSAREFYRLVHKEDSVIFIPYSLEREENAWYSAHAQFLAAAGVDVPKLLFDSPKQKFLIMEDLGHLSLESRLAELKFKSSETLALLYQKVLANLLKLHFDAGRLLAKQPLKLSHSFNYRLYKWERDFFIRQFVRRYRDCSLSEIKKILAELKQSAIALHASPYALIHRDLQSTNIMYRGNTPCFIDFQGMRRGPAAYDLASLLCDPYVELPATFALQMLAYYNRHLPASLHITEEVFWHAAVERLAQALGAFGRLGAEPATAAFANFIPAGLRQMAVAVRKTAKHPALEHLVKKALK